MDLSQDRLRHDDDDDNKHINQNTKKTMTRSANDGKHRAENVVSEIYRTLRPCHLLCHAHHLLAPFIESFLRS